MIMNAFPSIFTTMFCHRFHTCYQPHNPIPLLPSTTSSYNDPLPHLKSCPGTVIMNSFPNIFTTMFCHHISFTFWWTRKAINGRKVMWLSEIGFRSSQRSWTVLDDLLCVWISRTPQHPCVSASGVHCCDTYWSTSAAGLFSLY